MNKELLIEKLNNTNVTVNFEAFKGILSDLDKEVEDLTVYLSKAFIGTDINNKGDILKRLHLYKYNIEKVNTKNLEELYKETKDELIYKLARYYKAKNKLTKANGFLTNIVVSKEIEWLGDIYPTFSLNSLGGISVSSPSLPFTKEEITKILYCFSNTIDFNSLEEIQNFLDKYEEIIFNWGEDVYYFISGTTLYIEIKDCKRFRLFADNYSDKDKKRVTELLLEFCKNYKTEDYFKEIIENIQ